MFTWTREYRWLQPRLASSILHCNPPLSWPPAQPRHQETWRVRDWWASVQVINSVVSSQDGHLSINIGVFPWHRHSHCSALAISLVPRPVLVAAGRPDYLWAALWPRLWHHFYANHHIFHQLGRALKITLYGRKILHNRNKRGINISLTTQTQRVFSLRDTRLRCLCCWVLAPAPGQRLLFVWDSKFHLSNSFVFILKTFLVYSYIQPNDA